jgi:hypothetical protein
MSLRFVDLKMRNCRRHGEICKFLNRPIASSDRPNFLLFPANALYNEKIGVQPSLRVPARALRYPLAHPDCKKHRLASRIFKGTEEDKYDFNKCQCCGRSIGEETVAIPCCYDPAKELVYLGPGVPLMFIFTRMSMVLLTIFTLTFSLYAMITNFQGKSCDQSTGCDSSIFVKLSIANKILNSSSINIQNYLLMAFILLFMFIFQFMIFVMRKADKKSDELINSPSDYSLLVSQLPRGSTERDILEMVHEERHYIDD